MVYLRDGRLSIGNNIADRPEGARTIAVLHSLVQTAVANGLDPYRYLLHVFETMPPLKARQELEQLLPWNITPRQAVAPSALVA